jgi:hypothetical protein
MRFAGLLIAAAFAAQTLAPSDAVLVCRYTGQVLDPCACPQRKGPDAPALQSQSCCEWRSAAPATPAIAKTSAPSHSRFSLLSWALPAPSPGAEMGQHSVLIAARPQAPPGTPLYLTIRTLLI